MPDGAGCVITHPLQHYFGDQFYGFRSKAGGYYVLSNRFRAVVTAPSSQLHERHDAGDFDLRTQGRLIGQP